MAPAAVPAAEGLKINLSLKKQTPANLVGLAGGIALSHWKGCLYILMTVGDIKI